MYDEKLVLICEDSMEGIFTSVYDGWTTGTKGTPVEIRTLMPDCPELFCTYKEVETDSEKSFKVGRTIRDKLGAETYEYICYAVVSTHPDKGTAIFQVLLKALAGGRRNARIMEDLSDPYVNTVWKIHTKVWHEFHRFYGFVRFREIGGGVLFSKIAPENDILVMLAPHFENRFPNEHWMIYDERRRKVILHPKGMKCTLRTEVELAENYKEELMNTEVYEDLWKVFCESITVKERCNGKLQQQFVPLKFRSNMLEFQK